MKTALTLMMVLTIAGVSFAGPDDHWKANGPIRAYANSLGDAPGAHPCTKRSSIAQRLGAAKLAGKTPEEAKASLPAPNDPEVRDVADKVNGAHFRNQDELTLWEFVESSKCAHEYGLTKAVPYDPAHPTPPNKPVMP